MKPAPRWVIERQWRRIDGTVSTLVRIAGGRHVQVRTSAQSSTGPQIAATIEAAIAHLPNRPPTDWSE